jgi:hypothetical protein
VLPSGDIHFRLVLRLELIGIFQFVLDHVSFSADILDDEILIERARAVFPAVRQFEAVGQGKKAGFV